MNSAISGNQPVMIKFEKPSQSKIDSLKESLVNVLIGFSINFFANLVILPQFGFNISISQNLALGAIFTVISVARGYVVRRYFNKIKT